QDRSGRRRLEDENDWVRREIELALSRGVVVIPLLLKSVAMPDSLRLPPSLHPLVYLNALKVRNDPDFDHDMKRVIDRIEKHRSSNTADTSEEDRPEPTPHDLIERARLARERSVMAHAEARRLMNEECNYHAAAALLARLPANRRDAELYRL